MNRITAVLALISVVLWFAASIHAEETVLSDDGREVTLRDDGTWNYLSDDRYATSEDGTRIRLQSDGKWVEIQDDRNWVAWPEQAFRPGRDLAVEGEFEVELAEVWVESVRTKQQKNTRLRSQVVASLQISSKRDNELVFDMSRLTITDSRGRNYPLVDLKPVNLSLKAGMTENIRLIADGSPRWWGVKFFHLQIAAGLLGPGDVDLTKAMSEVVRREVETLTEL